ncbi:protein kinase [Rhodanobacter sp. L36]|uniref:protein kinase domain-containing protein n=1 Tax=Rhodanobacter sp. L36 TaxID=1747221 RepID=UPI00131B6106|nr:protein kinase [Rhodanobacter sp. L36]
MALFDEFAEMSKAERRRALARIKVHDTELHDELSELLAADVARFPLLEHPALWAFPGDIPDIPDVPGLSRIGATFGAWRAVGILGQGGMGAVYAVERSDGRHRQAAALKHVRSELSSPRVAAAFTDERDHLASLDHPGIVPLLDSGVDEQGRPWFVMRHIHGQPIDQWCDDQCLSLRERVALFLEACDAVAYAHEHGVLHQDLKPSNLLVTPDGRTQLLDFGLATALLNAPVGYQALGMTTQYTAPEVLHGDYPSEQADVYALGTLLYRLLCGQFPTKPEHSFAIPLQLSEPLAPEAPSDIARCASRQIALQRGCQGTRQLSRKLSSDLDVIALASVDPDPGKRYRDVMQLQHDLRQWLASRPVSVRSPTLFYRIRCLLQRRRLAAIAVGSASLLLMAALGFLGYQQIRAQHEMAAASEVDRLFERMLTQATLSGLSDKPTSPKTVLEQTEVQLRAHSVDKPAMRARGLAVLARNWALAGYYEKARALALEASQLTHGESLLEAFDLALLAQTQNLEANFPGAEKSARSGLSMLGIGWTAQHRLARVLLETQLATAQSGQGQPHKAQQTMNAALERSEKLDPAIGSVATAELLIQRGSWLRAQIRLDESERDLTRAVSLAEPLDPVVTDDARESLMRTVRFSNRPDREKRFLAMAEQLLRSRQHSLGMNHPRTGAAWAELAYAQLINRNNASAETSIQQAESILKESVDKHHPALARVYWVRADLETLQGHLDDGIVWTNKALEIDRERYGPVHEFTLEARFLLGDQYWWKFDADGDKRELEKARKIIGDGIADSMATYGAVRAIDRMAYATLLNDAGMPQQAAQQLALAHADTARRFGVDSELMLHVRLAEASFLIGSHADEHRVEESLNLLIADADRKSSTYAMSIEYSALLEQANWEQTKNRLVEARNSLEKAAKVADKANEPLWQKNILKKLSDLSAHTSKD